MDGVVPAPTGRDDPWFARVGFLSVGGRCDRGGPDRHPRPGTDETVDGQALLLLEGPHRARGLGTEAAVDANAPPPLGEAALGPADVVALDALTQQPARPFRGDPAGGVADAMVPQVAGPITPSAASPRARWKLRTTVTDTGP